MKHWSPNSTDSWMNSIESVELRLRTAFRLGRPSDVGQPALTPNGLSIGENGVIVIDEARGVEPIVQSFQPWMIRAGIYVVVDDFWMIHQPSTGSIVNLVADFTAQPAP